MRFRQMIDARSALLAGLAVGATSVELLVGDRGQDVSATAAILALTGAAALVVVRRHPLQALVVSGSMGIAVAVLGYRVSSTVIAPAVALYEIGRSGGRARTLVVAAVAAIAASITEYSIDGTTPLRPHTLFHVSLVAIPLLIGQASFARQRYLELLLNRLALADQTREETARRRVEEERLRIARDLHDVVAHALTTINVQAGVAAHLIERQPERAGEALLAIKQCSREALEELRGVVGVLRGADGDAPVEPTPDLGALDRLVADARRQGLGVDFTMPAEPTEAVPAAIQLAAFRIVEESLTNVRRHAGSAATTVAIGIEPQRICVRVRNAAAVTDPHDSETGAGVGILGMRERAQGVGGWLTAGPLPGGGYEVAAELPYRRSP